MVWTCSNGDQPALKNESCCSIFARLFSIEKATLLAIVLRFLVDFLPLLGEYDDLTAAATIRLYKIAFGAVASHPGTNEAILASHVGKLLMDCFPLAQQSQPTIFVFSEPFLEPY